MYHITKTYLANNAMLTIKHKATGNYISVITDYGGAINDFVVDGKQILRSSKNATDFENNTKKAFAGAQLFPFVNRINNARYSFNGNDYFLPLNDDTGLPHSLHGLIYNQPFSITAINEDEGKILLNYHFKKNEKAYPFEFLIEVEYLMDVNSLEINTSITNLSKEQAPVGYGWHPYFAVDGKINDCKLQLPATKYYASDERLIPTGKTNELQNFIALSLIGNQELNHCFEMPIHQNKHTTVIEDTDGTCIQLIQTGFSYTQYYIRDDRKSIAVEPQTCIPDALNNTIGLIKMQQDEVMNFSFTIIVQKK